MRNSLTNRGSQILTVIQSTHNIYPKCHLKKQHQKELLNLVCLTSNCKFKGPICQLCKKQHTGHNVILLKTFLTNVKTALTKHQLEQKIYEDQKSINLQQKDQNLESKIYIQPTKQQDNIKKLEQGFLEVMGMLKLQVLQLSEHIRNTQERLIKEFQEIKSEMIKQTKKHQFIVESLDFFQKNQPMTDNLEFSRNIYALIKSTSINKNQIVIGSENQDTLGNYLQKVEIYKENIYHLQIELKQMFQSFHEKTMIEKIKMNRPKTANPTTGTGIVTKNISFSSTLKAPNIILEKEGQIAKLKDNSGDKFVFVNNCIPAKHYELKMKIVELKGTISLGIALKDKIKTKAFRFQKNTAGHSAFLISSNAFKYNHSEKNENALYGSFNIVAGDEIIIFLDIKAKKITFKCLNDQKKMTQLSLKSLAQNMWKQLEFCAVFTSSGDKVYII